MSLLGDLKNMAIQRVTRFRKDTHQILTSILLKTCVVNNEFYLRRSLMVQGVKPSFQRATVLPWFVELRFRTGRSP